MTKQAFYTTDCIRFLKELKKNNDRDWFAENKDRYEASVREPSLQFIATVGEKLQKVSPFFPAIAKRVGGSLMRIHRDTRFGKDKTPYKTNVGIHFRHEACGDVHAPGFYVHLEPGQCFVGVGCWRPESKSLLAIRTMISEEPQAWKKARDAKSFKAAFQLEGDSLKTSPRDFPKDHLMIKDLRRKDFIGLHAFADKELTTPGFVDMVISRFRDSRPFMRFLCEAVGVPF